MLGYNQNMGKNMETAKLSDSELVVLALENRDDFLHIVNRYKLRLYNYIRRLSSASEEEAQDLLQEIFLKVYLNLNAFDDSFKFSSWIYSVAHNQIISNYRKLRARAEGHAIKLDDYLINNLASDLNIAKNFDESLLKDKISKVLGRLDKRYREVLILKFLEEKSYQEISDIIKRPMGTVASLLNKAKEEMKKEIINNNIKL